MWMLLPAGPLHCLSTLTELIILCSICFGFLVLLGIFKLYYTLGKINVKTLALTWQLVLKKSFKSKVCMFAMIIFWLKVPTPFQFPKKCLIFLYIVYIYSIIFSIQLENWLMIFTNCQSSMNVVLLLTFYFTILLTHI